MGRSRSVIPLDVYINNRLVGKWIRRGSGESRFRYERDWIDWEHAFPISYSLPLRTDAYIGDEVLAFFDNLLPDPDLLPEADRRKGRSGRGRPVQSAG